MIFFQTDNSISQAVGRAFEKGGMSVAHISEFDAKQGHIDIPVFYGILRGTGAAIKVCQHLNLPYIYLDNGYFEAVYRDKTTGLKDMGGMYRIVRNGLIEQYKGQAVKIEPRKPMKILVCPPTPYTAFMHDTIPEDWVNMCLAKSRVTGDTLIMSVKEKGPSFTDQLKQVDAVLAFNSMGVMEAAKMGKAIYTTHGIIRNFEKFETEVQYFDYDDLELFYETKQFTLEEISEGLWTQ